MTTDIQEAPAMGNLRVLCARMKGLQEQIGEKEEEVKKLKEEFDGLRLIQIPNLMESLEVKTATFDGIGRVQTASDLYCSTIAGRKDEAMQWLRDTGYGDMIKEEYNASSMKALIRRMIVDGVETPPFLNVTPFTRASIVKA